MASHRANAGTALELGRELLALAERLDDPALLLEGHHALWPVLRVAGRAGRRAPPPRPGYGALRPCAAPESRVRVRRPRPGHVLPEVASWTFWILGYPARGLDESLASLRLAGELAHAKSIIVAHAWACVFRDLRRESTPVARARACPDHPRRPNRGVAVAGGGRRSWRSGPRRARRRRRGHRPDQARARGLRLDRCARSCRTSSRSWPAPA